VGLDHVGFKIFIEVVTDAGRPEFDGVEQFLLTQSIKERANSSRSRRSRGFREVGSGGVRIR
jgi:hypothetical protein